MPYHYLELFSTKVRRRLIAAVWCFSFVWSILGIYKWTDQNTTVQHTPQNSTSQFNTTLSPRVENDFALTSIEYVPRCINTNTYFFLVSFYAIYIPVLVVMACFYVHILHVAVSQIQKIKQHNTVRGCIRQITSFTSTEPLQQRKHNLLVNTSEVVQINGCCTEGAHAQTIDNSSNKTKRVGKPRKWNLRKELQTTKSVAVVYLSFCVCWLPTCIITTIVHTDKHYFTNLRQQNFTLFLTVWYVFVELLPLMNFMINPIIYSFSNKQFRAALCHLWKKLSRKSQRRTSLFDLWSGGCATNEDFVHVQQSQ